MTRDDFGQLRHATIGALGTLSTSVMLRLAWQRARRMTPPAWQVVGIASGMAVAVIARLYAGQTPFLEPAALWLSAASWSLTYGFVALQVALLFRHGQNRRK
jgi:uncharacterized protein involved in response to NO